MANLVSPGVSVQEVDLTTVIPAASSSTAAFAGQFSWGPANVITQISNENILAATFGAPTSSNTAVPFLTCASFLAYGNDLRVVRAVNASTLNASANVSAQKIQITNVSDYGIMYKDIKNLDIQGAFAARFPGALGNSITVQVWDSANNAAFSAWQYSGLFNSATTTSTSAKAVGGLNDEFHVVVLDSLGLFTGTKNAILETYPYLSKSYDGVDSNGITTYYKNVIERNSNYILAMDPVDYSNTNTTWGKTASNTTFARAATSNAALVFALSGGTDATPTDGELIDAYLLFGNKEQSDISLVITGNASANVQNRIVSDVTTSAGSITGRSGDAIAFISPPYTAVVNQAGKEVVNIASWLNDSTAIFGGTGLGGLAFSSYVVADSGWKYMYDKYNNVYRYVPLNGDIAGLCAHTDQVNDPWWSPAGFNRGSVKNAVKLAWNPSQSQRDAIYQIGVNPVVSFPGNGIVLFGDKTLQSKPSAFDRINVRRLFIILEKSISRAAKYSLFQFNDAFTQNQFVSMVTPFLRMIQGKHGITDFKVVCDSTNNTGYVVDNNQFVGDIYIKPARSINYITLNFVAVGTGVAFTEVVGKY